jgi:GcrA cell cycle regulator
MEGVPGLDVLSEPDQERDGPEVQAPARKRPTLFQLRSGQCRFPIGGPKEPAQFFCGQPALVPRPYCRECCQRAYVVAKKR